MRNIVAQWYEDKKNVHEMQGWNSALKEWEQSVIKHFPSCKASRLEGYPL